jgi:4-amino-4-deoxy-L-arabinose transferase-like glycosyltransferase
MPTSSDERALLILRRAAEITALILILIVAAYLRLTNVGENPGWYTDEATHVDIARHLMDGRAQYMLINQSTLLFGRLPLFHVLLAQAFRLAGNADMTTLRVFTGLLGVVSVGLLYAAVRRGGAGLALLAALALAIYPQAVLYHRFGFSYNLLTPLVLMAVLGLERFVDGKHPGWLALAALSLGLGLITEVMALALLVPFILVVIRRPLHLLWSVPLVFVPFGMYALVMLGSAREAFLFDLNFTLSRLTIETPLGEQWNILVNNYLQVVSRDLWFLPGVIGLFALQPPRLRWISLLLFVLPVISVGRSNALYNLSAYYLIPFLPFIALGVAALIRYGSLMLYQAARDYLPGIAPVRTAGGVVIAGLICGFLLGAPLSVSLPATFEAVQQGYVTEIDSFLINPGEARQVAAFINASLQPDEVIIASPSIGWQFYGHPADFQMAVAAANHVATPHLPADIPADRLAFNPDYRAARYVVIDNLWRSWGVVHIPGLSELVNDVQTNWSNVFALGQFVVYENPAD